MLCLLEKYDTYRLLDASCLLLSMLCLLEKYDTYRLLNASCLLLSMLCLFVNYHTYRLLDEQAVCGRSPSLRQTNCSNAWVNDCWSVTMTESDTNIHAVILFCCYVVINYKNASLLF